MAIEDDDRPRKKITHEIGQDLSLLSVEELTERIALLKTEIERLEEAVTKKRASRMRRTVFQVVERASSLVPDAADAALCRAGTQLEHGRATASAQHETSVSKRAYCAGHCAGARAARPLTDMANEPEKIRSFTIN